MAVIITSAGPNIGTSRVDSKRHRVPCRTLAYEQSRTLRRFGETDAFVPAFHRMRISPGLWRYDAFAFGSKGATFEVLSDTSVASTPNSSATRLRRLATSPDIAALADNTSPIAAKAARRSSALLGSNFGMAANAAS